MIPNIFVSSTIADLQYLRDGLRDAIEDLAYNPVMSEFGEVGYLNPTTAAESCFRTVKECQMVVLIIGLRYGSLGTDGLSITHREFRTAAESLIPTITFIDPEVLSFKQVYDADPKAALWDNFRHMDHPKHTFEFVTEVIALDSYNGLIPFQSVADAKQKLKRQIADFVGQRLDASGSTMDRNLREVLAQISALRGEFTNRTNAKATINSRSQQQLLAMRFLLDDRNSELRRLAERAFNDLDAAIAIMIQCKDFTALLKKAGYKLKIVDSASIKDAFPKDGESGPHMIFGTTNQYGGYHLFSDSTIVMSKQFFERFSSQVLGLKTKLEQLKSDH